jgi:CII-binding regulator of phage lambda lysogenization HflD
MLKPLVSYLLDLLVIARDTQSNKEAIAALRGEVDELASAVERISFELRSLREEERHEREKLLLRMENALLRIERQLPAAKEPKQLK